MSEQIDNGTRPVIAVTMGDPAGVGPELCLRLLASEQAQRNSVPLIIGDGEVLIRVSRAAQIPFAAPRLTALPATLAAASVLEMPGVLKADEIQPGANQAPCGRAAARFIEVAVRGCQQGKFAAMVTAPISKKALNLAGVNYPGHTEMLADLTVTQDYAMLLYSEQIACAFVTCHQALRTVPEALTAASVVRVAMLAKNTLEALRGKPPRLCLLGLNPHAGEEGLFGDEEERILIPAMRTLQSAGVQIDGPLPPDTAFTPQALARYDCHIAMYHDQGSIPFKMLAFETGVNITMGLPIVRTSPDHGTAFDIAWQGKARPESFLSAYDMAVRLAGRRQSLQGIP